MDRNGNDVDVGVMWIEMGMMWMLEWVDRNV